MSAAASPTTVLDIPSRMQSVLDCMGKRPTMFWRKFVEYKLCALLAAWEAVTLGDSRACHWMMLWRDQCQRLHPGRPELTLADPVGKMIEAVPESEKRRAYQS